MSRPIILLRQKNIPLAVPVVLATGSVNATQSSIATASASVTGGDFLVGIIGTRCGATVRTHDSLTPSGWGCTFTNRVDVNQADTTSGGNIRASIWTGIASSAGAGALAAATNNTCFQLMCLLLRIPGGASFDTYAGAGNETGTTVSASWNATPDTAGLTVAFALDEGTGGSPDVTNKTAAVSGGAISISTALEGFTAYIFPTTTSAVEATGGVSNRAHIVTAVNILGA